MSPESTDFLYPFIEGDEKDPQSLLDSLEESARQKSHTSFELRSTTLDAESQKLQTIGLEIAKRLEKDSRLFAFGNGGSSTDAATFVKLFSAPPTGRALAARHLVTDYAVLSAISNDIGYDVVFSRQLIAHGRKDDVAVGFSTSGNSKNLIEGFRQASQLGMFTLGFAGYDGGEMARSPYVNYCLVVKSESIHRIQEVQAALSFALWQHVQYQMKVEA